VGPLAYRINHCHNGIVSSGLREFNNEVDTDGIPMVFRDWEWLKFPNQESGGSARQIVEA
jgi:hypothetical protein